MIRYNITLDSEDVQELFSSDEGLPGLKEGMVDKMKITGRPEEFDIDTDGLSGE